MADRAGSSGARAACEQSSYGIVGADAGERIREHSAGGIGFRSGEGAADVADGPGTAGSEESGPFGKVRMDESFRPAAEFQGNFSSGLGRTLPPCERAAPAARARSVRVAARRDRRLPDGSFRPSEGGSRMVRPGFQGKEQRRSCEKSGAASECPAAMAGRGHGRLVAGGADSGINHRRIDHRRQGNETGNAERVGVFVAVIVGDAGAQQGIAGLEREQFENKDTAG